MLPSNVKKVHNSRTHTFGKTIRLSVSIRNCGAIQERKSHNLSKQYQQHLMLKIRVNHNPQIEYPKRHTVLHRYCYRYCSVLGGIFDISSPNSSSNDTAEEAEFRRLMQWKKKKEASVSNILYFDNNQNQIIYEGRRHT